jgi:hypothetical protein
MSQPLSFSHVLTTTFLVPKKKHSSRLPLSIRNCETPFHEVIRMEYFLSVDGYGCISL